MIEHRNEFIDTIKLLDKHDLLEHLILIGSWAEYLYEKCEVVEDFISTTKTYDVDFLIKNINKPRNKVDLIKIFEGEDYLVDQSRNEIVVFRKKDFEIEFLARQIGKPESPIKSPALGIKAEALGHMSIIDKNTIDVFYNEKQIKIPDPYAFMLHKIIINPKRKDKKEKDLMAINNLYLYLSNSEDWNEKFHSMFNSLTKKEKKIVTTFVEEQGWEV